MINEQLLHRLESLAEAQEHRDYIQATAERLIEEHKWLLNEMAKDNASAFIKEIRAIRREHETLMNRLEQY